jgi:hypothetical protein
MAYFQITADLPPNPSKTPKNWPKPSLSKSVKPAMNKPALASRGGKSLTITFGKPRKSPENAKVASEKC